LEKLTGASRNFLELRPPHRLFCQWEYTQVSYST
jgi:hypothetical protein